MQTWKAAPSPSSQACTAPLSSFFIGRMQLDNANMESSSLSLFSGMHCTTILSFFIGRMQLDKANIASSLFVALHNLCPPAACARV
jgi:hypothetical protein